MKRGLLPGALIMIACMLPTPSPGEEPTGYLLQIPPGARAIAMGMAQGAVAEGPDAGYWNPAALAFMESKHQADFTYSRLRGAFDLIFPFVFAGYAARISGIHGALAVNFAYFDLGEAGQDGDTYRPYEMAPAVSYGGLMTDQLAVGVGFKLYRINYSSPNDPPGFDAAATTGLFDGGVLWRTSDSSVIAGGCVQNLGPSLELGSGGTSYPPPRNFKLSFAARLVDVETSRLIVACDLNTPLAGEDNSPRLALGGEMLAGEYAALRIGLRYDGWYLGDDSYAEDRDKYATTMGFGVRFRGFTFDYANAPWDVLSAENSHHFTFGARF